MAKTAILYCKRIRDHSCIACAECFKGMQEKNAGFGLHDEVDLVTMTDCGDFPALDFPNHVLIGVK
jgi:predicted metal-binding protein